ncbi:MAG: 5-dehydro-4-deoxyglucarate dehydratase [Alphaproteobacteria bacterium]
MNWMDFEKLQAQVGGGLLCFPVTHFHSDLSFNRGAYQAHMDWLLGHEPAALFAAGGTGEFFSLGLNEYCEVVEAAVEVAGGHTPVIAGCGYGTALAITFAKAAEQAGADGLLLLPPYLLRSEQEGLFRHFKAVCDAVSLGIIVYNRDNAILQPDTVRRLADSCPNLIGFKDGHGDIELLTRITHTLGDRLVYIGGMPTAEMFAAPYRAAGVSTYSSAVFNFMPERAKDFYAAVMNDDGDAVRDLIRSFFVPYLEIRNQCNGYAVSIVKAGLRVVGRDAGPVRPPITDLTPAAYDALAGIIEGMS